MIKIEQNTTLLTSIEQKISGKNSEFSKTLVKVEQFKKDLEELSLFKVFNQVQSAGLEPAPKQYGLDP